MSALAQWLGTARTALESAAGASAPSLVGPAAAQGAALLKLLLALGAVLAVFWIFARVFARFGTRGGGSAGLAVLGGVALGQRERLVVVQAGDTRLVLGVSAQGIVPVHVMDGTPEDEAPVGIGPGPELQANDFAARLRAALGRPVA